MYIKSTVEYEDKEKGKDAKAFTILLTCKKRKTSTKHAQYSTLPFNKFNKKSASSYSLIHSVISYTYTDL